MLEVCALASGSQRPGWSSPLARDVRHVQVGGDLDCAARASPPPDIVLNAVVGFAGLPATLWALERGVYARARQQGEPRRGGRPSPCAARGPGWRPAPPGRQRALRGLPVPRGARARGPVDSLVLTAWRRPVPRRNGVRSSKASREGRRAGPSDVADGPQDQRRLGHARQQGARADRGALPVRPALTSRSRSWCIRPRSSTRSSASATAPRSRTSVTRICESRFPTR